MDNSDTTIAKADVELGYIAVLHEVDIDTESVRTDNHDDSVFFDEPHSDNKDPLRSSSRRQGSKTGPTPIRQSNSGGPHAWKK
jgi:hypothetical protein